jgi:hypothetical protein
MNPVTHVQILIDQPTLQTLLMGLEALKTNAAQAQAVLTESVNAAIARAQVDEAQEDQAQGEEPPRA